MCVCACVLTVLDMQTMTHTYPYFKESRERLAAHGIIRAIALHEQVNHNFVHS